MKKIKNIQTHEGNIFNNKEKKLKIQEINMQKMQKIRTQETNAQEIKKNIKQYKDHYDNTLKYICSFYEEELNSASYVYALINFENLAILEYLHPNIVNRQLFAELSEIIDKIIKGRYLLLRLGYGTFTLVFGDDLWKNKINKDIINVANANVNVVDVVDIADIDPKIEIIKIIQQELHEIFSMIIIKINNLYNKNYGPICTSQVTKIGYAISDNIGAIKIAMQRAQIALQAAKLQRESYSVCFSQIDTNAKLFFRDINLTKKLQNAFLKGHFQFELQGIYEVKTNSVTHYEALLRINNANNKVVSANKYIRAAERLGAISSIDVIVLEMAVDMLKANKELCLNVNMSRMTAKNQDWRDKFSLLLNDRLDLSSRLSIEITETGFGDECDLIDFIKFIKKFGCKIALDDFGAGHTSLSQLKNLSVDFVKIDGELIVASFNDAASYAIVKAIVDICKTMNILVVAEFVKTTAMAKKMNEMGVDYLQGRYFDKKSKN